MDARTILGEREATVCVVRYRPVSKNLEEGLKWYNGSNPPANPAVLHQVALLGRKVSASGNLIRCGETTGDELMGWQWLDALEVVEVLGELAADGRTVEPIEPGVKPLGNAA